MECIYRVRFGGAASQSKPADRDRDPDGKRDSVNGRDRMTRIELGQRQTQSWERGDKRRERKKAEDKNTRDKRPEHTASAISRAVTSALESARASTRGGRASERGRTRE